MWRALFLTALMACGGCKTEPRCSPTGTFDMVRQLTELSTPAEEELGRLSPDELTIFFSSFGRTGADSDLYMATRDSSDATFTDVTEIEGVNTDGYEAYPTLTADARRLIAAQNTGAGSDDVVMSERSSTGVPFPALAVLANVNSTDPTVRDADPYLLPDGSALYFTSSRTGETAIYRSPRSGDGYAAPTEVSGVDLDMPGVYDGYAVVTPDELTLFFFTERGTTGGDIYVATRESTDDSFGAAVPVSELNTPVDEYPNWVSSDGCVLSFTRQTTTASGDLGGYELFIAQRGF